MLNPKALTSLLTSNRDGRLCRCWYIMTTNGTLLAYSQPVRVSELRRQAALAALRWMEHDRATKGLNRIASMISADGQQASVLRHEDDELLNGGRPSNSLHRLIVEDEGGNVLVQRLQDRLLLVLEGGSPPPSARATIMRVTVQWADGSSEEVLPGQPLAREDSLVEEAHGRKVGGLGEILLGMQTKKLDALAAIIADEFEQSGFVMPDDGGVLVF